MSFPVSTATVALRYGLCTVLALGLLAGARRAAGEESCKDVAPWSRLASTAGHLTRPVPLTLVGLAVATPFGFAPTGLDQRLRVVSQRDLGGRPNLEPVTVATPYVLAGGLVLGEVVSALSHACGAQRVLAPVLQAGTLTFLSVSLLKLGVGRRFPNGGSDPNASDRLYHPEGAHDFEPFQRGFAGWPSGHTALMVSAAAAFRAANPGLGVLAYAGYPLALGVAAGMWLGDHHYMSDILSGALIGEAVGDSVGRSFARELNAPGAFAVLPLAEGGLRSLGRGPGERAVAHTSTNSSSSVASSAAMLRVSSSRLTASS